MKTRFTTDPVKLAMREAWWELVGPEWSGGWVVQSLPPTS